MASTFPLLFWTALGAAIFAGLLFGSFLNVCIARLPAHASVVTPRSRCLACGTQIRAFDNIPVASWLWLRGRCRDCKAAISIQYPLVEIGTAALFLGCVLQTGMTWQTLIDAVACFLLFGLAVMDAQTMLLPDSFTLTGLALAFFLRVCAPGITGRIGVAVQTLVAAAIAAGALLLVLLLYWLVRRRQGIGLGDVKLLAMMAAFLGLALAMFAYFVAVLAAAVFAIVLVARKKARGDDPIPFGSFLAGAGIFAIFAGHAVLAWYMTRLH